MSEHAAQKLSSTMITALGEMPVKLRQWQPGGAWFLPSSGPNAGTLKALERRGLIELDDAAHQWQRTQLGELVWSGR